MKRFSTVTWGFVAAIAAIASACDDGASTAVESKDERPPELPFFSAEDLEARRASKDSAFVSDPDSPLPDDVRESFAGLEYFEPNDALRFTARLRRYEDPKPLVMITTEGDERPAVRAGWFEFDHDGRTWSLQAYELRDQGADSWGSLFVPFTDETSGVEVYGAGRYLELSRGVDGWYLLDFNLAHLPLCAYGKTGYGCPRTPPENHLEFAVQAGERGWISGGPRAASEALELGANSG